MHGMPVPDGQERHTNIEVTLRGDLFYYQRFRWFEFEDVGDGEVVFVWMMLDDADRKFWSKQVLRPC